MSFIPGAAILNASVTTIASLRTSGAAFIIPYIAAKPPVSQVWKMDVWKMDVWKMDHPWKQSGLSMPVNTRTLLRLRITVLCLGESEHAHWWPSQFLSPVGLSYLEHLYPRSTFATVVRPADGLAQRHNQRCQVEPDQRRDGRRLERLPDHDRLSLQAGFQ